MFSFKQVTFELNFLFNIGNVIYFKIKKKQKSYFHIWEIRGEGETHTEASSNLVNECENQQPSNKTNSQFSSLMKIILSSQFGKRNYHSFTIRMNSHCKKSTCKCGCKRFINVQFILVEETYKLCRNKFCGLNICF